MYRFCFQIAPGQVGELFLFSVVAYSVNLFHNKPVFFQAFDCILLPELFNY